MEMRYILEKEFTGLDNELDVEDESKGGVKKDL